MKALLDEMAQVLDRLADGESFDTVVEETGITAKVSAARQELAGMQDSPIDHKQKSRGPSL